MNKAILFFVTIFILLAPASANVFVSEPSNEIITAPAASFTNSQLILSDKNPSQAVLNYLNGKTATVFGDISLSGEKITADSVSISSKYWTTSDVVVLGTGQDVSAALVAIKNNAPLLVVGNTIPDNVNAEIQKLSPKKIIVCASPSSIPDSVLNQYSNIQTERVWNGNDENTLTSIQSGNTKIKAPLSLLPVAMALWKDASFSVDQNVTVNDKVTLWSSNDITTSVVMNSYANNNLPVIYITCDNLISESNDKDMLNKIKDAISGSANVDIDNKSPKPGEAPRAIQNAPGGIAAYIAAVDPGSMVDLIEGIKAGYLKKYAQNLDGIVFVNYGKLDLDNMSYLPRAWDDNYSSVYFAGLYDPSKFLESGGVELIQPNVGTSSQDEEINKIASGLIDAAYSSNANLSSSSYDSNLIGIHEIDPEVVAYGSQSILDGKKPRLGTLKWLYLASQYVSGYPIQNTSLSFSGNISGESTYFGVLTIDEYREAGNDVSDYMGTNKTIPDSVTVDGKKLNKADMRYIFAELTYDHTSKANMTFPKYIFVNKASEPFNIIFKFIKSSFYQIFS
ncbi:cell wall-binding repeat-containing protein [Methanobacterium sp.]|uniref:cell wall-binding repeat-containing protein n=1 Tax=Methanobacterium sp. TaxID=2164 RepID=UPI003158FC58